MINILFLAPCRVAPLTVIKYFSEPRIKGKVKIKVVCTDKVGLSKFKKFVCGDCVFINNDVRNERPLLKHIKNKNINLLISIQHPWIISEKVINSVGGHAFNNHMARLPDYRGHHTSVHAILNGEKHFTTTLHTMEKKVDVGLEVASYGFNISKLDTSLSLQDKMAKSCLSNVKFLIERLIKNQRLVLKEIKGRHFYYSKNSIFSLRQILDSDSDTQIDQKVRAFFHPPHEPAFKIISNKKVYFLPTSPWSHFNYKL